jgi:hypothetical protein
MRQLNHQRLLERHFAPGFHPEGFLEHDEGAFNYPGHSGENNDSQPHEANQAVNVENLRQRAKLGPFRYHTPSSFPKNLELVPAVPAFFIVNLYCAYSNRSAHPRYDGV